MGPSRVRDGDYEPLDYAGDTLWSLQWGRRVFATETPA